LALIIDNTTTFATLVKEDSDRQKEVNMAAKEEFLSIQDLQTILKCGRTTAYSLVNRKAIRATRVGKSLRIRRSDLERFIEENRT